MPAKPLQRVDRALLIGVDNYQYISPMLSGCVGDVEKLSRFLVKRLRTSPKKIIKLTSSLAGGEEPDALATRDNIVRAFKTLAEVASKGDQIYIHYSGHGMRNDNTLLPGIEPDGRDEAIAPADSGYSDPAAFYLLDKELGWLVKQITDTGAFVTFVSDCCHSATMTRALALSPVKIRKGRRRDGDVSARSWEGGDPRPRPDETLVAPLAELKAVVLAGGGSTGSLLPAPANYILLTGCRERETAKEYKSNGVLTYFMVEHLENADLPALTYRALADVVGSKIVQLAETNPSYRDQTPQLEGNGNLIVFGGGVEQQPAAMVATPMSDGRIRLSAGSAVGLAVDAMVALYPPGAVDLNDPGGQLGVIRLTRVDSDVSFGDLLGKPAKALSAGMRAIVVRPGATTVRRRVAIGDEPELEELRRAIARGRQGKGSPFLQLVKPQEQEEFSVRVRDGAYVIQQVRDDQETPVPRLSPPIAVNEQGAAERVVRRLEQLVQYRNAWELSNDVDSSTLNRALAVSIRRDGGRSAGRVQLRPGDTITVLVHNRSDRPVSAALFYFAPDWSITRIWPDGEGSASYAELAVNGDEGLAVWEATVSLPAGVSSSIERMKLFATDRPTSFDALSLGSLDTPRKVTRSPAGNALERLLAGLGKGLTARELTGRRASTGDWGTAEIELETSR